MDRLELHTGLRNETQWDKSPSEMRVRGAWSTGTPEIGASKAPSAWTKEIDAV